MDTAESSSPAKDTQLDSLSLSDSNDDSPVKITIKFPPEGHNQTWALSASDTFEHLIAALEMDFPQYDWTKSKALVEKRPKGLKPVYTPSNPQDMTLPLSALNDTTLRFLAPATSALSSLQQAQQHAAATAASWQAKRALARARYARLNPRQRASADELNWTFHTLRPLPHLPNAERSLAFLERLRDDPGIRTVMRRHKFSVGLLTEMDPAAHTAASHEGVTRILGLNRNRGEVIELRLRTDAYDGWRNYYVIRKTLCHELAHNVYGEHDAKFWALCKEIEKEVEKADWKTGGRTVGDEEYAPAKGSEDEEDGMVMDHGGWEGGTYVLGGGGEGENGGLSAREIRARAAEARWSKLEKATRQVGDEKGEGSGAAGEKKQ